MEDRSASPPAPMLNIELAVHADESQMPDFKALPPTPGVFVLEDETGGTLALATTANLRRMVAARLEPVADDQRPTRRIDYRKVTRTVRAVSVGGRFEADWAYLQLARTRVPSACRAALDRWQAWFVRCDPDSQFPQWTKTAHPGRDAGAHLGPLPDKHAAGKFIDLLEDAFDLCRYHHILVQAPNATACAYKEMGKCPAPCDGSISMQQYRAQVRDSIECGAKPLQEGSPMSERETASRLHAAISSAKGSASRAYEHVASIEDFRYLAVMPSERECWSRWFVILGGCVTPWVDVPIDPDRAMLAELFALIESTAHLPAIVDSEPARENLALVCWHFFRPPKSRSRGSFLRLDSQLTLQQVRRALKQLAKPTSAASVSVEEQFTEDARVEAG